MPAQATFGAWAARWLELARYDGRETCSSAASASCARPDEADLDRPALEDVLAFEDADVVGERAEDRRVELAGPAAVGPVDRPSARRRVEEAKRHAD
jgi:hypothetical protein